MSVKKYYLDTCIWRDHYEDRFSLGRKPLGALASKLFLKLICDKDIIVCSEVVVRELGIDYSKEEIELMFKLIANLNMLQMVTVLKKDYDKARQIAIEKDVPLGDALHAVLAKNSDAVLVTQDKHFQVLQDYVTVKKPEHII